MSDKQQKILTHIQEILRRVDEVDEMMWEESRYFKQRMGARQAELHYPVLECQLRLNHLMQEIKALTAIPGAAPDLTPEESPPLSQDELDRIREVLSRKSVTDAISANAPECPELRNLPTCNTIPYGNPTHLCHPMLVITPNDASALSCLGQALQHLGLNCPYTRDVVIRNYCTPSFWQQAWGLYEPSFRALSQRQGFNLYLL
jgi:hypothetical protein